MNAATSLTMLSNKHLSGAMEASFPPMRGQPRSQAKRRASGLWAGLLALMLVLLMPGYSYAGGQCGLMPGIETIACVQAGAGLVCWHCGARMQDGAS